MQRTTLAHNDHSNGRSPLRYCTLLKVKRNCKDFCMEELEAEDIWYFISVQSSLLNFDVLCISRTAWLTDLDTAAKAKNETGENEIGDQVHVGHCGWQEGEGKGLLLHCILRIAALDFCFLSSPNSVALMLDWIHFLLENGPLPTTWMESIRSCQCSPFLPGSRM